MSDSRKEQLGCAPFISVGLHFDARTDIGHCKEKTSGNEAESERNGVVTGYDAVMRLSRVWVACKWMVGPAGIQSELQA